MAYHNYNSLSDFKGDFDSTQMRKLENDHFVFKQEQLSSWVRKSILTFF